MKLIAYLLSGLFSAAACAQEKKIQGFIRNPENEPVPYMELRILDSEENYLESVATDSVGHFEFLPDHDSVILEVQDDFYAPLKQTVTVNDLPQPLVLHLQDADEQLSEMVIRVKRPKIRQKPDRLVFDVENSTLSGLNTWEILKRTPNLSVKNNTLQVRNNSSVVVTINDKKWLMSAQELQTLLENTPGDELQAIEVITNPPAQYEASGAAIVNIRLKENKLLGYKGTLYGKYEQSMYAKGLLGTSNFYNTGRWNFAASFYHGGGNYVRKSNDYVYYEEDRTSWRTVLNRKDTSKSQNTWNIIAGYQKDSLTSFNFGVNGFYQPNAHGLYNIPTTIFNGENEVISSFRTFNDHNDSTNQVNMYGQFQKKLRNHTFSSTLQVTDNKTAKFQDILTQYEASQTRFTNDEENRTRVLAIQADDSYKKDRWTWDNGLKFSTVSSDFTMLFSDNTQGNLRPNPLKSNHFDYSEQNYAAYTGVGYDVEHWAFKAGLRAEYTDLEGTVKQGEDVNRQSYLQWFPTLYARYTFKNEHQLGLSYGKRITRPFYTWLNPAKSYYGEYSYFQGDPRLRPTITHNIELNYSFKNAVFTPYYRYEKFPAMEIVFQIPENKNVMYRYTNIQSENAWGLQVYKNFELGEKVSVDVSGNTEYKKHYFRDLDQKLYENKRLSFNGRANLQVQLNTDKDWTLNASYFYTTPSVQGTFTISGFSSTSLQMNRRFWNRKLEAALAFNDIFYTEKMKVSTRYANQDNYFIDASDTRKFILTLRYHFGNQSVKAARKIEQTDEQNRL